MDRRLIGALLVVLVMSLAIVVPAREGLRVAGSPSVPALPAAPQVGDCLRDPPADAQDPLSGHKDQDGSVASATALLGHVFGPCTGSVTGEVVAVVTADPQAQSQPSSGRSGSEVDCRAAALEYAGLSQVDDRFVPVEQSTAHPVRWSFSIKVEGSWVRPAPLQRAAGQSWEACVATAANGRPYQGRLAAAFGSGRLPDEFGVCWDRREPTASIEALDCDEPHLAELISVGRVIAADDRAVGAADVYDSCQRLASRVMQRADPTAAGGLAVRVAPELDGARDVAPGLDVYCYIAPVQHALTGTLVSLRNQSVPYSG